MIGEDSGAEITEEALNLMTKLAGGGLRDGISLLDQCITSSDGTITGEQVAAVSGIVDDETLMNLLKTIGGGALSETIREYELLKEKGKSIGQLLKNLMEAFKNMLLLKTVKDASNYIVASEEAIIKYQEIGNLFSKKDLLKWVYTLGELESQLKWSTYPDILLEVTLVKGVSSELGEEIKASVEPKKKGTKVVEKSIVSEVNAEPISPVKVEIAVEAVEESTEVTIKERPIEAELVEEEVEEAIVVMTEPVSKAVVVEGDVIALWKSFLEAFKKAKPLCYAFYVEGEAVAREDNKLFIAYDEKYTFHKERGETDKHRANAEAILSQVAGKPMKVVLQFKVSEVKKEVSVEDKIKDIFGEDVTFIDS